MELIRKKEIYDAKQKANEEKRKIFEEELEKKKEMNKIKAEKYR